jgi:uncharacterized membrane protein YdbT with pleckstrin-like domain
MTRYCIVEDQSGHRWICPLDKKEEVEKSIEEVEEYWETGNYDRKCPEDLTHTYNLPTLEGGVFSFTEPQVDGKPVN